MKERLIFWQVKRKVKLTKKQFNAMYLTITPVLKLMVKDGYLLSDVRFEQLSNDYLFGIFDTLWNDVDNLKSKV